MTKRLRGRGAPLQIDEVSAPGDRGIIGMSSCPGQKDDGLFGDLWDRDLEDDLRRIREWGGTALITLLEEDELKRLGVTELPARALSLGLHWIHLPVREGCVPDETFADLWNEAAALLHRLLDQGGKIVIHCRGGLGRTGTVAARLLVERGVEPEQAIRLVRAARPGTVETFSQEQYVRTLRRRTPRDRRRVSEQNFSGCLLGGAAGDALGWPVEFLSLREIRERFGHEGLREPVLTAAGVAEITDDTQMTLFTAEGLLHARSAGALHDLRACVSHVHAAYLRWLATQGELRGAALPRSGGLVTIPEMNARRAPGATCLNALASGRAGTIEHPLNDSKGCGGVMRVAPVGLICAAHWGEIPHELALSRAFELGCRIAAITHGHPSGYLSAGAFAAIIFGIARGNTIAGAVGDARSVLAGWPGHDECLAALDRAVERAGAHDPDPETVSRIGEGWTGEEALAIGLYAALAAEGDFAEGVRIAVNHDGDSDSTGSIAGSILGLHDGRDAIPLRWLETLELKDVVWRTGELLAAP